jgi:hypothetical protein
MGRGPATYPYIAGTYIGTFEQTGGTGPQSGPITIKISQYLDYLSGLIKLKYSSHRARLRFSGFLKQRGNRLGFKMKVAWRRTYAPGHARVESSNLSGRILLPAHDSVPETIIAFKTQKT